MTKETGKSANDRKNKRKNSFLFLILTFLINQATVALMDCTQQILPILYLRWMQLSKTKFNHLAFDKFCNKCGLKRNLRFAAFVAQYALIIIVKLSLHVIISATIKTCVAITTVTKCKVIGATPEAVFETRKW